MGAADQTQTSGADAAMNTGTTVPQKNVSDGPPTDNAGEPPSKKTKLDGANGHDDRDNRRKGVAPVKAEYVTVKSTHDC